MTLRVMLAAIECPKGDTAANLASHESVLRAAREAGCRIAVFPEVSLSGYANPVTHPEWLLSLDSPPVLALAALTGRHGVAAVFGITEVSPDGVPYLTQVYARDGAVQGFYRKRHLGEDEEAFTKGTEPATFRLGTLTFGVAVCAEAGVDFPFDDPVAAGAKVVFLCSAPGLYGRRVTEDEWRAGFEWWESAGLADARRHAKRTGAWVAMATQAGSTFDEDFPGIAALIAPSGEVVSRLPDWRPGTLVVDVPVTA
ncbi:MAG TPA: carbon-nitrogen hydrolase family protein [Micromonosporaceae bacterium]|nr:carbon-nitrogen hydrolase family protein [Micromonosporaceae bacterium]